VSALIAVSVGGAVNTWLILVKLVRPGCDLATARSTNVGEVHTEKALQSRHFPPFVLTPSLPAVQHTDNKNRD
jgi:hypothetical protein